MNKYLLMTLTSTLSLSIYANDGEIQSDVKSEKEYSLLNKGNYEAGGGISFSKVAASGGSSAFMASPKLQYFVMDKLSIGGSLLYYDFDGSRTYGIGPSASYYFWEKEKVALYVSQAFLFSNTSFKGFEGSETSSTSKSTLGVNYFVTPSVALGVTANYEYGLSSNSFAADTASLRAAFSVYF